MVQPLIVNSREIGPGRPAYCIAEMSANHNGSLERAKDIIRAAADSGADAVKLQTYTPDTMTLDCGSDTFRIKGTVWAGQTLHDLYAGAYTPWKWHESLLALAGDLGLDLFSTPFDATAVNHLESLATPVYKVASLEIVDHPLLEKIGGTGKPVILSTGASSLAEIDDALRVLRAAGAGPVALLRCVSAYPAPVREMNLRTIPHLAETFGVVSGLSDHSLGWAVAVAAVALGASIVEKHFTLARSDGGADSTFSMEPAEFEAMVRAVRDAEQALGAVDYTVTDTQKETMVFRRSLFAARDIQKGERFTNENVRVVRPGHGLHPRHFAMLMAGKRAAQDIPFGTPLTWEMVG